MKHYIYGIICLSLSVFLHVQADIKGSSLSVSVESYFEFPENPLLYANQMAEFGWFKNGFALENANTDCDFDSVFPVSGNVNLNGGNLTLNSDLIFADTTNLQGMGIFVGNNHRMHFCSSMTAIPDAGTLQDVLFSFDHDVVVSSTLRLEGTVIINGNSHAIMFDANGCLFLASGAQVTFCDMEIEGIKNGKIVCEDDAVSIIISDTDLYLDADFSYTQGSIAFKDHVSMVGTATFSYESGYTSTVSAESELIFKDGACFRMGRKLATNFVEPLYFEENSSLLSFDDADWIVTETGFHFTRGTISFDKNIELQVLGTSTTNGIIIGDGTVNNDATIEYLPGVALTHRCGYLTYQNTVPDKLVSSSKESRLIRHEDSHIYVAESVQVPAITIQLVSVQVPPLEVAAGKSLDYNDSRVSLVGLELDLTSNQLNAYTYYLNGGDSVFLSKGTLPLNLQIAGSGNTLRGVGNISGSIIFEDAYTELITSMQGLVQNTIYLNGGTLTLANDLSLDAGITFSQEGIVDIGSHKLKLGEKSITWESPVTWIGTSGNVEFFGRLSLDATWTFSGFCILYGDNATLELLEQGEVVVAENSTLILKNMRILDLKDTKIRCLSDTSRVIFSEVEVYQSGDYTFDTGSIFFARKNIFSGPYTFAYESNQTSTVDMHTECVFTDKMRFEVGRSDSVNYVEPLAFTNNTSVLHMDNATFAITGSGMAFTKGTFLSSREVDIDVVSTSTAYGLCLGNGIEADDPVLSLATAAEVTFGHGAIVYDIVSLDKLKTQSSQARIIRNIDNILYVKQNLQMSDILITMDPLSVFIQDDYTIFSFSNTTIDQSFGEFRIKGTRLNIFTNILSGNENIFLVKGILPLYTVVTGAGNVIQGNGTITGGIVLQDTSAQLVMNLNGYMANDIALAGSTIQLTGPLTFAGDASLAGQGLVILGQNILKLSPFDNTITSTLTFNSSSGGIELKGGITLSSVWTVDGDLVLRGNGNTVTFDPTGQIVITDGSRLICKDVMFTGVRQDCIVCASDDAQLALRDVTWIQDADYTFSVGSISFENTVSMIGSYTFAYESSQSSTIQSDSIYQLGHNILFKIGRFGNIGTAEPLVFTDSSSILSFENCSMLVTDSGVCFTKGTIVCQKDVQLDVLATNTIYGLILGDGTEDGDFKVELHPGASARFNSGASVINSYSQAPLRSFSQDARMARANGSWVHVINNTVLSNMTFEVEDTAQFTLEPDSTMIFDHCTVELSNGTFDLSGIRYTWYSNLLSGNHEVFLTRGRLDQWTFVTGANNIIHGNGAVNGYINFVDSSGQLMWNVNGLLLKNISLNGGLLTLNADLLCGIDVNITGAGTIDVNEHRIVFGPNDLSMTSTLLLQGTGGGVVLDSVVDIQGTWTIDGTVFIDGRFNELQFGPYGQIVVNPGSHLELYDVKLKNFGGDHIVCLDDTASWMLKNVECQLSESYSFSTGRMLFESDVVITGSYVFSYESTQSSTIAHQSRIRVVEGATFAAGRVSSGAAEPIILSDSTSSIEFDNANFSVSSEGMQLSKGKIVIGRDVVLDVASTSTVNGLVIGDGTQDGDTVWELQVGSLLTFNSGHVVVNTYQNEPFISFGRSATLFRKNGSVIHTMNDLLLTNITFEAEPAAVFSQEVGADIVCVDCLARLANGTFDVTAVRYNFFTNLLNGNQSIFVNKGVLELFTRVASTGNKIHGNGNVSGLITLVNENAELIWALNGLMSNNIILNNGRISLQGDLNLSGDSILTGSGIIDLDVHHVHYGTADMILTNSLHYDSVSGGIDIHAQVELTGTWTLQGTTTITGHGNSLIFSSEGSLVVAPNSLVRFKDITLQGIIADSIVCQDDSSQIIFDDTTMILDGDYTFSVGSLLCEHMVNIRGDHAFIYDSNQSSTIDEHSVLRINDYVTFELGRKYLLDDYYEEYVVEPLIFIDNTAVLNLNNCDLSITSSGVTFAAGKIICEKDIGITIASTSTMNGLDLGDGTSGGDMVFELHPGCTVDFKNGHATLNSTIPNAVRSFDRSAVLKRSGINVFYLATNTIISNMTLDVSATAPLVKGPGVTLQCINCPIVIPGGSFDMTAIRDGDYSNILAGNNEIFITKGLFPLYTLVTGTNNKMHGNGTVSGNIIFLSPTAVLNWSVSGLMLGNIAFAGSKLNLDLDLEFGRGATITGAGTINLAGNQLMFGPGDLTMTSTLYFDGAGSEIDLQSNVILTSAWTFSGTHRINGHGNNLDLDTTGKIIIEKGSQLTLHDMDINKVSTGQIICLDDASELILENVYWNQDADYAFTQGSLDIKERVRFSGKGYKFVFGTSQDCTIHKDSMLELNNKMTFSYDPAIASKELIVFEDESATLLMNDAVFHTTVTGVEFTKGHIVIEGTSCICAEQEIIDPVLDIVVDGGITIGDGYTADNDCIVEVTNGSSCTLASGSCNYRNINQSSWIMNNRLSKLKLSNDAILRLFESLDLGDGVLQVSESAEVFIAEGKELIGSVFNVN